MTVIAQTAAKISGAVMVIGGGVAGVQTALDLTELGYKVYLVEKESTIGGNMAKVTMWYDNEWGYSCRTADLIKLVGSM